MIESVTSISIANAAKELCRESINFQCHCGRLTQSVIIQDSAYGSHAQKAHT